MPSSLSELSLGAIVALLVLKEVFGFLKTKRSNGSGLLTEMTMEAWRLEHRTGISDALRISVLPLLEGLIKIADELASQHTRNFEMMLGLGFKADALTDHMTALRASTHQLREKLQELAK